MAHIVCMVRVRLFSWIPTSWAQSGFLTSSTILHVRLQCHCYMIQNGYMMFSWVETATSRACMRGRVGESRGKHCIKIPHSQSPTCILKSTHSLVLAFKRRRPHRPPRTFFNAEPRSTWYVIPSCRRRRPLRASPYLSSRTGVRLLTLGNIYISAVRSLGYWLTYLHPPSSTSTFQYFSNMFHHGKIPLSAAVFYTDSIKHKHYMTKEACGENKISLMESRGSIWRLVLLKYFDLIYMEKFIK